MSPIVERKWAIPKQMHECFFGVFSTQCAAITLQVHGFPVKQVSCVDPILQQQLKEDLVSNPYRAFPNELEERVSRAWAREGLVHFHGGVLSGIPGIIP